MSSSPLFSDRLINLAVTGGMIRLELGVAKLPEASDQAPQIVPSQTLVMPIEGFVYSFGIMEQAMKKLIESGAVKMREPVDPPK